MIDIVCLHILRMHARYRESRSNACFYPRAELIMCVANSVLTFHVSSPRPLYKSASSLRLYLFHCLSFSLLPHGFERRWTWMETVSFKEQIMSKDKYPYIFLGKMRSCCVFLSFKYFATYVKNVNERLTELN